ncbi:MAG: glycosyltransferase [Clostridia bacterium]|nr:glycosyltransferase [Clostridia bacterium]
MKIVQINATYNKGSTGKIVAGISDVMNSFKIENYVFHSSGENRQPYIIQYSNKSNIKLAAFKSRVFGNWGFNTGTATKVLIGMLSDIKPEVVHLHNIHGHNCDLKRLFAYFKKSKTKVVWTFHDCWAFTGYCTYFDMCKCEKWQIGCSNCVQKRQYSWFFDRSTWLFDEKKKLFSDLDLTVVTPSIWLADLVKQSFLKNCTVEVINNGIDLNVFKPKKSKIRQKYALKDKKIILGVALEWENRKGLDVFIKLSKRLSADYKIILVGTSNDVDKLLPDNIISIHRTQNQNELAELYTAADLFVNPTREDNYPTVNIEALACGTPVVTFKTGGSPEMLDESCGSVVECDDIDALEKEIIRICTEKPFTETDCLNKAKEFDKNQRFKEYIELYERIVTAGA